MKMPRIPAPRAGGPRPGVAPALAALALVLALGACGGTDSDVETSTIEMEPDATAPAAPETDLSADAEAPVEGAIVEGADALGDGADAVAAGADDAWTSLQANWADSVDEVQAHFGELSEEDVLATGGDRQQLVAMVQERYNLAPEEAEQQVADWEATL